MGIPPETDEKSSKNAASSNSDLAEFRYRVECLIKDTIYITGSLNCFQRVSLPLLSPQQSHKTLSDVRQTSIIFIIIMGRK